MKWQSLSLTERAILEHLYNHGPNCAKFIARKLTLDLKDVMDLLKTLQKQGWIQRVEGRFLKPKGWRKTKHMNHTYYTLTREAKLLLRRIV